MKSIVSVLIILNFVLSAHASQESIPLKYLTKFASDQPTLQQQVVKRQTSAPTPEDVAICAAQRNEVLCTAGIQQGLVEARLSCDAFSSFEAAQQSANLCAKGEGEQFCGSLWGRNRLTSNYIRGNCSSVLTANESCPSNCSSLLEDFRSTLGCCIDAYVNGTGLFPGAAAIDYRVWNLCNVSLPPAACGNGPIVNPPANVQSCTGEDFFNKVFAENYCLPERRQAYTDVLESSVCGDSETASIVEDACSVDTNGVPCGTLYYRSLEDLARLDSACINSSVSCTSSCKDGIIAAKNRYGCCFRSNWFNTPSTTTLLPPSYRSSSVLQSCDIELPGACEGLIGSAVSTMKTNNYITLIVTALMIVTLCWQLMMTA